jgi:nucleoside-diphosphate-sugar epimerase
MPLATPPVAELTSARPRVLVTGATGVLGSELMRRLRTDRRLDVTGVSARGDSTRDVVAWRIGGQPAPGSLRGSWQVIVHAAASTRWTMTVDEAHAANVEPLDHVLELAGERTHVIHVSTAYALGLRGGGESTDPGDYRNPYEWSKAMAEQRLRRLRPDHTIVRPPLIIGRRADGVIARFSGSYSLLHALTSGLAAAFVGDRDAQLEIVPVDDVAQVIEEAVHARRSGGGRLEVLASGAEAPTFQQILVRACELLNEFRAERGVAAIEPPPFIDTERWERFFLPFGRQLMRPLQLKVIDVLREFQVYTARTVDLVANRPVPDPLEAYSPSVRYWIERNQRSALRVPQEWN